MPTHLDSIFFLWSGHHLLRLVSPLLCLVSTAPVCGSAPTASRAPLSVSLLASPSTPRHGEISSPKLFVWFRAKTDKGIVCLAGHLHRVTDHIPLSETHPKTSHKLYYSHHSVHPSFSLRNYFLKPNQRPQ